MTRFIAAFCFFQMCFLLCKGQKCVKILSIKNEEVPFATIVNSDNSYGKYSDENGNICVDVNLLSDTIFISSVGYKRLIVFKKNYLQKDKFFLEETYQELKEVIVKTSKLKRESFYTYNKTTIAIFKHIWNPNTNILVTGFIENTSRESQTIEKVKFVFSAEKSNIADRFKIRFRFFDSANDRPNSEITQTNITTELSPTDKMLEYDVSSYNIEFPENGVWVGMEVVGYYNFEGKFIPLENGKSGKAIYKNNGKIKKINTVSPSYDLVKTKNNKPCYTKDFLNKWSRGIKAGNSDDFYTPKIELITISN
jgi:hypothetical protein